MWQREPIDVCQIETLSEAFFKRAEESVEFVIEAGRDPNVVTRCVAYLARAHAIPPMRDDTNWFGDMFECLLELSVPNCGGNAESENFYRDLEEGLSVSRSDYR
jgi:hypothetical protein